MEDKIEIAAWLILTFPLISAVLGALFLNRAPKVAAGLSTLLVGCAFGLSIFVLGAHSGPSIEDTFSWLDLPGLHVDIGVSVDALSALMAVIVTGVATAVFCFSTVYMRGDRDYGRYFSTLSFFVFTMLGIVYSSNFAQMFIFWELVGVASYLLIGFWYEKKSAADAGLKAFLTNRVGDFGFLLGIIMVWSYTGTLHFAELQSLVQDNPELFGAAATCVGVLLFCGAVGKSAQFPLHTWLPDAMEGPTPVSALIHAATMVAAGVFMLCRISFMLAGPALEIIAWIGGITALLAALIALQQNDIKRVLAYSTLSQLGYMVMAVGVGAPDAAMFHLTTHAFFKALLFLGAGAIIFAAHHEQNIWRMGGLKDKMPVTFKTFFVGSLALCGIFPLSGFYSKDAIIAASGSMPPLFVISLLVAFITSFYMFRALTVVFLRPSESGSTDDVKEAPQIMVACLVALAVPAALAGWIGIDGFLQGVFHTESAHGGEAAHGATVLSVLFGPFIHSPVPALIGLFLSVLGATLAWQLYRNCDRDPVYIRGGITAQALRDKLYLDEIYEAIIGCTHGILSRGAALFDRAVIGGALVGGLSRLVALSGRIIRLFQSGNLQTYAILTTLGVALLLFIIFTAY